MTDTLQCKLGLVLALSFCLAAQGCRKAAEEAEKPIVSVQAAHPRRGTIAAEFVGDAVLAPIAQAAIQSKVPAPIKAFYVQRGATVKAGQLLATLENKDLAAAVLDSKGGYTAAQGAYATASEQQIPQEETQARLDLEQARATHNLDESIVTARSQLFAQGAIPGRDVDTAKAAALQAQAAFQIAQLRYDSIAKVGRTAALETAEGQLASAKGKYLGAESQMGYSSIRSPIAGVVTERPLFAGETATVGAAIVTVMDTSVLIAKLHMAQTEAQQLSVGNAASISVPGLDGPVAAKVSLISPALDPGSTTVEVWLRVANPDGRLKAGSAVHAAIQGPLHTNVLLIPTDAVQRAVKGGGAGGGKMVMVIDADGTAQTRNILPGIQTKADTQVLSGLAAGDLLITSGGFGLNEGTKVRIEAASSGEEE